MFVPLTVVLVVLSLASEITAQTCYCLTADSVHIRDAPCGNVIATSPSDGEPCYRSLGESSTCSLSGTTYTWYEVDYVGGSAWIADTYLVNSPCSDVCYCLTTSGVNVRSSACGSVITTLSGTPCYTDAGGRDTCSMSGTSYDFYELDGPSSQMYWIASEFITNADPSDCSTGSVPPGPVSSECMQCICNEEGCGAEVGKCDEDVGSLSCGPFQIKEGYWTDCGSPGSTYEGCTEQMECSEECVQAYMERYGTYCTGGSTPTCEDYARIHNGGPHGCTCTCTESYWEGVSNCCVANYGSVAACG